MLFEHPAGSIELSRQTKLTLLEMESFACDARSSSRENRFFVGLRLLLATSDHHCCCCCCARRQHRTRHLTLSASDEAENEREKKRKTMCHPIRSVRSCPTTTSDFIQTLARQKEGENVLNQYWSLSRAQALAKTFPIRHTGRTRSS